MLCCLGAGAQEIDIFEPNDFVDPRERGAVFRQGGLGLGVSEPGPPFSVVRISGGGVSDYQWRTLSGDADLSFLHVAASHYWSDKQLNLKFTAFRGDDDSSLPSWRGTAQFGQYYGQYFRLPKGGAEADEKVEEERIATRLLFTWSVEDNPFTGDREAQRDESVNHEFGLQTDVRLPMPGGRKVDGSFIWMRRRIEAGSYIDRASYLYRFRERLRSNGRLHLNLSLGFGAERAGEWHCCLGRAVLTATFLVPRLDTGLNVAYAPTFSPGAAGRRTHHEFAIYLDRTVFARLADIAKQ